MLSYSCSSEPHSFCLCFYLFLSFFLSLQFLTFLFVSSFASLTFLLHFFSKSSYFFHIVYFDHIFPSSSSSYLFRTSIPTHLYALSHSKKKKKKESLKTSQNKKKKRKEAGKRSIRQKKKSQHKIKQNPNK